MALTYVSLQFLTVVSRQSPVAALNNIIGLDRNFSPSRHARTSLTILFLLTCFEPTFLSPLLSRFIESDDTFPLTQLEPTSPTFSFSP